MNLTGIFESFPNSHLGTESFKALRQKCENAIYSDTGNAAVYFFIAEYCRAHVNFYEDQEISPVFAHAKHEELSTYLETLQNAINQADAANTYYCLNKIVESHFRNNGIS